MAKWNIQSRYVDTDTETLEDFETDSALVIEADSAEEVLNIAFTNGDIPRHTAVPASEN